MGNCSNGTRVSRADVERRIMTALKERLIALDLIAEFTRAYQEEVNRWPPRPAAAGQTGSVS